MRKNETKPISIVFLVFIVVMIIIIILYATAPKTGNKENNEDINNNLITTETTQTRQEKDSVYIKSDMVKTGGHSETKNKEQYDALLDSLKDMPLKNIAALETAVNKILEYKGYPDGLIKITQQEHKTNLKVERCFPALQFNIAPGEIYVDKEKIQSLNNKQIVAVLIHELDHFEKIAQICKAMSDYEFIKLLKSYNVEDINGIFWARAAYYANLTNFETTMYKNAFIKYLRQNQGKITSPYADFYRLTENLKNPLELSAYRASDYVQKHYGIIRMDTPIKIITRKFNEVDWEIYNLINSDKILKNEKTSVFDYFYGRAIIYRFPYHKDYYDACINNKNGDLTLFWSHFEQTYEDFYTNRAVSQSTLKSLVNILGDAKKEVVNRGISDKQVAEALEYRVRTLLSNISHPGSQTNIRKTALSYLKFIKEKKIQNPKTELDFILTIMCIDNNLTKQKIESVNLSKIKVPEEFEAIYNINPKDRDFGFIYANSEFQNIQNKYVIQNEELLMQLLNSHRINIIKQEN